MALVKKYWSYIISGGLLVIVLLIVPWSDVWDRLGDLSPASLIALLACSLAYYAAKVVRFWYMLRRLGAKRPLATVALTYLSAQPMSLLPAGEFYRCVALERYAGVPIRTSSPTFLMQGLLEGIILAAVSLIGVLALGKFRLPVIIICVALALSAFVLRRGLLVKHARVAQVINKLPYIDISRTRIEKFGRQNQDLLHPKTFAILLGLSVIPELAGIAIVVIAVTSLGGHISWFNAMLAYTLPIIVTWLSLLPGGLGAAEPSSIGLLRVLGLTAPIAAATTILMRLSTLGMGLLLGYPAGAVLQATHTRRRKS